MAIETDIAIFKAPKSKGQVLDITDRLLSKYPEIDQKVIHKHIESHFNILVADLPAQDPKTQKTKPKKEKAVSTHTYILDADRVLKEAVFTCHKINNNLGIGILLPEDVPVYSGRGKDKVMVGYKQINSPAVLTSDGLIHKPNLSFERENNIRYVETPINLPLRFSLAEIKKFINGTSKKVNPLELFNSIRTKGYERCVYFPNPLWYDVHTLWDIGTYFSQLFNAYPILELNGLSGTGKSKTMKVSRLFSYNPTDIMVNPSEASIFRLTHTNRPTKYIDEAEKLYQYIGGNWQSSPIIELINGSYSKGSTIPRAERINSSFQIIYYACYSPTMVGSITGLRDATATRAISHILTRSPDSDNRGEIELDTIQNESIYQEIRDDLYLFLLNHYDKILSIYDNLKPEKIKRRDWELWKPILSIARYINEAIYQRVLTFAIQLSEQKKADFIPESSMDYRILLQVKKIIDVNVTEIRLKEISQLINQNTTEPIAEKTISAHLDKIGFKDYRKRDRLGSYFDIDKSLFFATIQPICPSLVDYSQHSSHSSQLAINDKKIRDEEVMNSDEYKNKDNQNVTNVTQDVECDESLEKRCNSCGNPNAFIILNDKIYCVDCARRVNDE